MKKGDFLPIYDIQGHQAKIGDTVRFVAETKVMEKEIIWDEEHLCVSFGNLSFERIRNSGYFQSSTSGKKYLDFEIL
jgi:hypothetical protein